MLSARVQAVFSLFHLFLLLLPTSLPAQEQFAELTPRALAPDLDDSRTVILIDVDGDGDLDAIFGNEGQNRLQLGDGHGLFQEVTGTHLPEDDDPTVSMSTGDVDGDGDLDLLLGNSGLFHSPRQDRLYLNDGKGHFTDVTKTHLPALTTATTALALADVTRDGKPDILIASAVRNRLWINIGGGRFQPAKAGQLPAGKANGLVVFDLDGDRDLDLVMAGSSGNRLYLNKGTGNFVDATAARLPYLFSVHVAAGDIDHDGDLDLVFGGVHPHGGQTGLMLNDGKGVFKDGVARLSGGVLYSPVRLGDLTGDGTLDIYTGNTWSTPYKRERELPQLLSNDGRGTFKNISTKLQTILPYPTRDAVLGDLDGDGDLDVVSANSSTQNTVYLNDGKGTLIESSPPSMPRRPSYYADLDQDGDMDILVARYDWNWMLETRWQVHLQDADGRFRMPANGELPRKVGVVGGVGDLNGDGSPDLLVTKTQPGILLNDGRGGFSLTRVLPVPLSPGVGSRLVDIDGDQDLDLLAQGARLLLLNDGNGKLTPAPGGPLPSLIYLRGIVDVDGDRDLDLIVLDSSSGKMRIEVLQNDGKYHFLPTGANNFPPDLRDPVDAVVLGDLDGDGDLDCIIPQGLQSPIHELLFNDGKGFFRRRTPTVILKLLPFGHSVLADLDLDGDLDYLVQKPYANKQGYRFFLNDGKAHFTPAPAWRQRNLETVGALMAVKDMDADGDLDLVVGTFYAARHRLFKNLHTHLHAVQPPRLGSVFKLRHHARPGYSPGFQLAFSAVSLAPSRIPLPPHGTLRLDPSTMFGLPLVYIPRPGGAQDLEFKVPAAKDLIGRSVHFQSMILDPVHTARLTNIESVTIR